MSSTLLKLNLDAVEDTLESMSIISQGLGLKRRPEPSDVERLLTAALDCTKLADHGDSRSTVASITDSMLTSIREQLPAETLLFLTLLVNPTT